MTSPVDLTRSAQLIGVHAAGIVLAWTCLFAPPASAGAPTDQLKAPVDEVIRILRDPRLKPDSMAAERRAAIRKEAESIFDFPETAKRAIGYVPQDLAIYPDRSARENLRFCGRLQHLRGRGLDRRVDEVLDVIALADRAKERVEAFSGGMKRRLNIGIGLLHGPKLLVLDEPTVCVAPQSRNAILSSAADLEGEGMAILYTTHYMEEAERLCDRIGIIDEGRIKAEGTRRQLVELIGGRDRVTLVAGGTLGHAAAAVKALDPRIDEVTASDGKIEILVTEARSILPAILSTAASAGATIRTVEVIEPDLEAVFLHLTGKALRD